ncbi:MAG: type II CRISPR RNA-guided endonuclease Cas9 [Betaproteobacteria bacterium]
MGKRKLRYRIGLDLGTNSIGWCIYGLSPDDEISSVVRTGVRIFPEGRDPKSKASLAADRRLARSMRRRRDRYLARRTKLLNLLVRTGLLPQDASERRLLTALDPYVLRRKALDKAIPAAHLGRALFHLNQRRGFKSNRRVDRSAGDEKGKISIATKATQEAIAAAGARTYGEWLAMRHVDRKTVRARKRGMGKTERYELYASREMLLEEFEVLIAAQRPHHPQLLGDTAIAELRDVIFHQRALKPVVPGKCTLDPSERRAPLALPSVQQFRIYQELNNLRVIAPDYSDRPLSLDERDRLARVLERSPRVDFDRVRRTLKLSEVERFNLESDRRKDLKGNATSVSLAKKDRFGPAWHDFPPDLQDEVVGRLLEVENEEELIAYLRERTGVDEDTAASIADAGLPDGFGRLGRRTLSRILPHLKSSVCTYDQAVIAAGFASHSSLEDGEILPRLPYYGQRLSRHVIGDSGEPADPLEKRFGRIANPTVHVALNQLRYIVNAMISRYGHPTEIVVETARDLPLGAEGRNKLEREQKENQQRNDRIRSELEALGTVVNGDNMTRFKLWEELNDNPADRRCPYSGKQISLGMLFSEAVEVDHILPFSATLDDSLANKTVCVRQANRDKGNSSPWDAFGPEGHHRSGYTWDGIHVRAAAMKRGRAKRFSPNALADFLKDSDFLARQLNDTRYISRIAREYLSAICPGNRVHVVPGRLTALLRGKWGLHRILSDTGRKERDDHRHHAVDAAVVGATDRSMLQQLARAAEQAGTMGMARIVETMPVPWDGFRAQLEASIRSIVVSFRPDHSPLKQLHNDTAYGIVSGPDKRGTHTVVHRKPVTALTHSDLGKLAELAPALAQRLTSACEGKSGTALRDALVSFSESTGVRRVRIAETLTVIPVKDRRDGATVYKAFKGDSNHCIEIFRKDGDSWGSEIVTTFDACQVAAREPARLSNPDSALCGASLVMRLRRDDLVAMEEEPGRRDIFRVAGMSINGSVVLCRHMEANVDKRSRAGELSYVYKAASSLRAARARQVTLDPLGWVIDPGFR